LSGMADAAEMLTHVSSHIWVIVFAVGISIATIRLRYYQIAGTLKWLALTLFAYVISAFVVQPDWSAALHDTLKQASAKLARWVVAVTTAIMFFTGMMIFV